MTPKQISASA